LQKRKTNNSSQMMAIVLLPWPKIKNQSIIARKIETSLTNLTRNFQKPNHMHPISTYFISIKFSMHIKEEHLITNVQLKIINQSLSLFWNTHTHALKNTQHLPFSVGTHRQNCKERG
jgi:hypothetical protein